MKILHVISSLDPKGGGPMEGVRQYGQRLPALGHELEVVTMDNPASPFLADYPMRVHALGPSHGTYAYNVRLVPWLREHVHRYDAVVVNGLWQYHGFGTWRALRKTDVPYFVFTHGMLDPWFKHTYPLKHFKKWLYWPWAEYRLLRDARAVLFTSEEERLLARKSFWLYKVREKVVRYGAGAPPSDGVALREHFVAAHPELRGKRLLLFLSRIHKKKGCDLLVAAFARVARTHENLHLVMAGPDPTGLVPRLQELAKSLSVANRISWPGMLQDDNKWGAFYASEAFVLPSHQENFGIAVAEALGCGLPVLISNKINTWREIQMHGAGFVEPDTVEGTEQLLRRWLALDDEAYTGMRLQAAATFESHFSAHAMAASLVNAMAGPSS